MGEGGLLNVCQISLHLMQHIDLLRLFDSSLVGKESLPQHLFICISTISVTGAGVGGHPFSLNYLDDGFPYI